MLSKEANEDVVVFFDYENIVYSLRLSVGKNPNFEILMDKCQEYGRVVLARAYADWSRHSSVIPPLQASGFDPVYVPTYYYENQEKRTRKNAVDIHIAIEAIETMHAQPHIQTFVLLTGDKDFIPLATALRRHGKTVIAIGVKGTTSPYMRQVTDDFVFYHQLLEEDVGKPGDEPKVDIYQTLISAVKKLDRDGQKTVFPAVKHTMSEMLGSFNEKEYTDSLGVPFNKFKDFILEAQRLGHVTLVVTGSVNEVLLPGMSPKVANTEPEMIEPVADLTPKETPQAVQAPLPAPEKVDSLEDAFALLIWAVNHAQFEGKSLRVSSIKNTMRSGYSGFDEKQMQNKDGENFAKFSDFCRAAAALGLVEIKGKGIKMEIHPGEGMFPDDTKTDPEVSDKVHVAPFDTLSVPPGDAEIPVALDEELPDSVPDASGDPEVEPIPEVPFQPITQVRQPLDDIPEIDEIPTEVLESMPDFTQEDEAESEEPVQLPDIPAAPLPEAYVSDYRMRVLVIDALRNGEYPVPGYVVGQYCMEMGEVRHVTISKTRLAELLTAAQKMGLLQEIENDGSQLQRFVYVENKDVISRFLNDDI